MQDSQLPEPDLLSAAQTTLPPADSPTASSAGQVLRQAREAAQVHRASLAGLLKVPVKKIEALENDDWQALPDTAFTRALASSICRQLKIAPQPILALLPSVQQHAPEKPATLAEDKALAASRQKLSTTPGSRRASGIVWATAALFVLGAAAAAWWWQSPASASRLAPVVQLPHSDQAADAVKEPQLAAPALDTASVAAPAIAPAPSASAAVAAVSSPTTTPNAAPTAVPSATPSITPTTAPSPTAPAQTGGQGGLELQAKAESWVQVRDAQNKVQVSRLLQAGERVQVQGLPPYRVWTGRAEALQLLWKGQPVDALQGKTGALRLQIPAAAPAGIQP